MLMQALLFMYRVTVTTDVPKLAIIWIFPLKAIGFCVLYTSW